MKKKLTKHDLIVLNTYTWRDIPFVFYADVVKILLLDLRM